MTHTRARARTSGATTPTPRGTPQHGKRTVDSFRSLVVPAIGVTMARFRVASRLYSVDLPTFGLPTITTRNAPPRAGALSGGRFTSACRKPSPPPPSSGDVRWLLQGHCRGLLLLELPPPPRPARGCVLSARSFGCGRPVFGGAGVAVCFRRGREVWMDGVASGFSKKSSLEWSSVCCCTAVDWS